MSKGTGLRVLGVLILATVFAFWVRGEGRLRVRVSVWLVLGLRDVMGFLGPAKQHACRSEGHRRKHALN